MKDEEKSPSSTGDGSGERPEVFGRAHPGRDCLDLLRPENIGPEFDRICCSHGRGILDVSPRGANDVYLVYVRDISNLVVPKDVVDRIAGESQVTACGGKSKGIRNHEL